MCSECAELPLFQSLLCAVFSVVDALWWGLLFGIVAVAVIGRFPRELVAAVLGKGGTVSGLFRAVGAGVMLDHLLANALLNQVGICGAPPSRWGRDTDC